jgi:hypothetical protein
MFTFARRNLPPDAEVRPNYPLFPCRNLTSFVLHVSSVSVPARGGDCFSVDHVGTAKHAANHRGKAQWPETNKTAKGGLRPLSRSSVPWLGTRAWAIQVRGRKQEPLRGIDCGLDRDSALMRLVSYARRSAAAGYWPSACLCMVRDLAMPGDGGDVEGPTEAVEAVLVMAR